MSLFLALLLVATAVTQEECPDAATECPNSCAGKQCARYLNAECQENPCHGLCTPNFFWRGRNVTYRCPVEGCGNKTCPGLRQCVEEVRPALCPGSLPRSLCRQYIHARCVLPPPPTDCSQISCGPGMICQERRRRQGVTCVQAQNCKQLTCKDGSICTMTEQGPLCVVSIALSCKDLSCPEGTVCVTDSIPSFNLSVAQCLDQEEAERLPTVDTFFCSSGATICDDPENEICVDVYENGNYVIPGCMEIGCDPESPSSCQNGRVCTNTPNYLIAPFETSCVGTTSVLSSNTSCAALGVNRCPENFVCRDVFFEGQMFFTTCGAPAPTFIGPSCADLVCPAPLECNELGVVQGRGGVARCAGPEFTSDREDFIRSLLDR